MKNKLNILLTFSLLSSLSFGQKLKDFDIDYMLRGHIYAKSSIRDSFALGGFANSTNLPLKISDSLNLHETGLFLKIDTIQIITINQVYRGYKMYLCNKSDSIIQFDASDSRLSVIAEVYYKNEWVAIEYLPSSWCGNSYHTVYLNQNEFWTFKIPKFNGKINTKLRYKLILSKDDFIYSNEITASFNKGQLTNKEGYEKAGLMDPYDD